MSERHDGRRKVAESGAETKLVDIRRLREAGQFDAALSRLRPLAEARPQDPIVHSELGLTLLWRGDARGALAPLQRAAELAPKDWRHHYNAGSAWQSLGRDDHAITALRRARALAPDSYETLERLGNLMLENQRPDEARTLWQEASRAAGDSPFGGLCRAKVLHAEGDTAAAETALRGVLAASPEWIEARRFLANILAETGRFADAEDELETVLEQQPGHATSYYDLVHARRITEEDRDLIAAMTGLLSLDGLSDPWRIQLQFALGKAHDDLGEYGRAMQHYEAGNRMVRARLGFDRAHYGASVNRVIAAFSAPSLAERAGQGSDDETPILIVGMPRSGTTLLERILSAHPEVAGAGELLFWTREAEAFAKAGDAAGTAEWLDGIARRCLADLHAVNPSARRVTDKMPPNFMWLGLVRMVFPRARVIHIRRHPIDTALSNYFAHFSAWAGYAYDRTALVFYYRMYERIMAHWRRVLPPEFLLDIDYEDLVQDREATARRIIAFCGLEWNDACLDHTQGGGSIRTASMWQARQPTHTRSIERWRRYEPWLGDFRLLLEPDAWPRPQRTPEAEAHLRMATRHRVEGRLRDAASELSLAAGIVPHDPRMENEAGLIYLAQGDAAGAVATFERAIALDDGYAVAHYNLACALERLRRADAAIAAHRRALELDPSLAEAAARLGNILTALEREEEAKEAFAAAAAAAPRALAGRLASVKLAMFQERDALADLRQLVADFPDSAEAHRLLGNTLAEAGDFPAAAGSLEAAIAQDPAQIAAWYDLARVQRAGDRKLLDRIERRMRQPDLNEHERAILHFALGKLHDDLAEPEAAMRHFDAGHAVEHAARGFDRGAFAALIDRMMLATPRARAEPGADPSEMPVLIVGMPRSGTTLVEQIAASHPLVAGAGELRFWTERMTRGDAQSAWRDYIALLGAAAAREKPGAVRVTDKAPFNFLWLGAISRQLPGARFIHCRRDPRDTCLSIWQTRFAARQDFAHDKGDLAFYWREYARLTRHWRHAFGEDRLLEIDYETLVREPEYESRRIIEFLGLPWDDACLHPEANPRTVRTASLWQARQRINDRSVGRWRAYAPWLGDIATLGDKIST